jgi:hypothetical protein
MSQFWDTHTPDCNDCKSYERDLAASQQREAELTKDVSDWKQMYEEQTQAYTYLRDTAGKLHQEKEALRIERDRLESARKHTQEWYACHYGKLEDWARKSLPEPWVTEVFNCIANGVSSANKSDYFRVDTAEGQLVMDQTKRAEDAEQERDRLREERDGLSESREHWKKRAKTTLQSYRKLKRTKGTQ